MAADEAHSLDEIRANIDRIDSCLLDLLGERMAAVEGVRRIKEGGEGSPVTAMRPGREALILRRLVAERPDNVPADLVLRLWHEIIAAATRMQVPLKVHLIAHGVGSIPLGLVHARFGVATPVDWHDFCADAVRALGPECADVAVVGLGDGAEEDWISDLVAMGKARPRVIAMLPFLGGEGAPRALVLGHAPFEATGDDTTVLAVMPVEPTANGGTVRVGARNLPVLGSAGRWRLVGADGLISQECQLVDELRSDATLAAVAIVGTFANPIPLPRQV